MRKTTRNLGLAAALAVGAAASAVMAQDAPSTAELRAQIDALQKKVDQIEARQAAAPQNQATASQVQTDAASKSQIVPPLSPLYGGYDKGFKIKSADGNYVVQPGVLFQFRNITNYRDGANDLENGFELRRLRLRLDGNFFSKNFKYSFVLDNNRNSGATTLLDAWVQYNFTDTWGLKIGQFRNSWSHEGDVSDNRQLADERGLLDYTLAGTLTDREQGVAVTYGSPDKSNPIQGEVALTDGDNSKNTDFRDSDGPDPASRVDGNFGASGRFSYKWEGNWSDYYGFSARGVKDELFVTGAGIDFSENGDVNVTRMLIDAQYENPNGLSAFVQANYNDTSGDTVSAQDYGIQGQIGYVLNPQTEIFGRYAYLNLDTPVAGESNYHELTAGVNYWFGPNGAWGNALRLTVDLNYLPNGSPGNITGLGYLAGTDSQFVLRTQLQFQL